LMEADFWLKRWQDKQTGFHQQSINTYLQRYFPQLGLPDNSRVLVPLCGKSLDMLWLAERYHVAGIELSPCAVEEFFLEHQLQYRRSEQAGFSLCKAAGIELYCGDFFTLQATVLGRIDAVYDRAALIALPADMRTRYVSHLSSLCPIGTQLLLVTMAYNQAAMNGPPFSVEEKEVHALFGDQWQVELLCEENILEHEPRFRDRGLDSLSEYVYWLKKV
ncbi:Thiopurine S-methyltransferase, partial [hydrothermal vent metagenome]